MCGIAGIISGRPIDPDLPQQLSSVLAHRGPDDCGFWLDQDPHVALVHRRLAIVDLSPAGHQPMLSPDGRYVLIYNGEIYNHAALRKELERAGAGPVAGWRGHSDTETLLAGFAFWGVRETIERAVGMFAVALWDRREKQLILARDRFGEKPLYYGWVARQFVFASEIAAIRAIPSFDNPISRAALRLYAGRAYVPEPHSIYERVYKLPPGTILTVSHEASRTPLLAPPNVDTAEGNLKLERYWNYEHVVAEGLASSFVTEQEALDALDLALADAVGGQALADVPVGALLSGGIDSSTVVAFYQKHSTQRVRTFSIGFEEQAFNEADHARKVATHFGTDHNELYLTAADALDVIPSLPGIYGEPFADSSQIPTYLVSRFAREQVTVALSGDAGDELFGGYNRYLEAARIWARLKRLPPALRAGAGSALAALPPGFWNAVSPLLPGGRRPAHFGSKARRAFRSMGRADSLDAVYGSFVDEWGEEAGLVPGAAELTPLMPTNVLPDADVPDAVRMMACDALTYLPGDILCKVDRAAMAVSLETRVPFLDHRVAAVAARIPLGMKIHGGKGKLILRKLLYRHAPRELFERPKSGFSIPIGEWLRGPLRAWAEALLDERRLREDGFFDPGPVRRRWADHLAGRQEAGQALWPILMFGAWREAKPEFSQAPRAHRVSG